MRKLFIIRSLSGRAKDYTNRFLSACAWFDDAQDALTALEAMARDDRPWSVAVPVSHGLSSLSGVSSRAMAMGYVVESRSVP